MGLFKEKLKSKSNNRMMLCPKCQSNKLRYKTNSYFFIQQPKLSCPDCQYSGYLYLDGFPSDDADSQIDKEFLLENPDFIKTRKKAWELAKTSLEVKWIPNQADNIKFLRSWCPFCEDVHVICEICKCPPEICAKNATEGIIGDLNKKYPIETKLCDIDQEKYQKIVQTFQYLSKHK